MGVEYLADRSRKRVGDEALHELIKAAPVLVVTSGRIAVMRAR